jgi:ferritin-like metal-binding protein YciE
LSESATSYRLKQAFNDHLQETTNHVNRLEQVFRSINEDPKSVKCHAMAGIVEEGEDIIDETEEGTAQRDVGLIFAAQKAEHYEIATYGGLLTLARTMGHTEAASLLQQTLDEEKNADELLTKIAEEDANVKANTEKITD